MALPLRTRLFSAVNAMKTERESFVPHWRELTDFVKPRAGRFLTDDVNKGGARNSKIINGLPGQYLRVASAGLLAGVMSPARPWFKLETPDKALMEYAPVKLWLEQAVEIIRTVFRQSNLYAMAPPMLTNLLLHGTGVMTHVDDFENVARFYTHPTGSYVLSQNDRLQIDTFAREYKRTCRQLVQEFGIENVSASVKNAYDKGNYHAWFDVVQFICPNEDYKEGSPLNTQMKYLSAHFEPGGNRTDDKLLGAKGFQEFPGYAPRWEVEGGDIYGTNCPGMVALGDVKGLQVMERRKAQGIDKQVNPPLVGPASLRNTPVSSLPGGVTMYEQGSGDGLKPLFLTNINVRDLTLDMDRIERRLGTAFFNDLFRAISDMPGIQPRNELDLTMRDQERLLQLGPVLEQVHGEFLNPMVDRVFAQCLRAGIFPDPPEELQGLELKTEYISPLAMAQRAVSTGAIDRLSGFVGGLAAAGMVGALDKFDPDQAVDEYAYAIGAPVRLTVPDDVVAQRRAERQKAQAQAQAMEQAQMGADVAGKLAAAKPDNSGDSVLKTLSSAAAGNA